LETYYKIHNNLEHCGVSYHNQFFSYYSLKETLKERTAIYKTKNRLKNISDTPRVDDYFNKFKKSNLNEKQLIKFKIDEKQKNANSWKTSLRRRRKTGKLSSERINILNKLGMVWNPKTDEWEKMFLKYKGTFTRETLDILKLKNGLGRHKISSVLNLDYWVNSQRILFINDELNEENLLRLKSIKFPFQKDEKLEKNFSMYKLISFIGIIENLNIEYKSSSDRGDFIKHYNLGNIKNYIGSSVEIKESNIFITEKKELEKQQKETYKFNTEEKIITEKIKPIAEKEAYFKLNKIKSSESFLRKINSIYSNRESFSDKCFGLNKFIVDEYSYNFKYEGTIHPFKIYYKYSNDVKDYAKEKILSLFEKELNVNGIINSRKALNCFENLLRLVISNNIRDEIIYLTEFVNEHQFLQLKYGNRLKKVLKNERF
jgi:hypothetical protein